MKKIFFLLVFLKAVNLNGMQFLEIQKEEEILSIGYALIEVKKRSCHTSRDFICDYPRCSSSFTTAERLRDHKKTHEFNIIYTCDICNEVLGYRQLFHAHLKNKHNIKTCDVCKTFCPMCLQEFKSLIAVCLHMQTHSIRYRCIKPCICAILQLAGIRRQDSVEVNPPLVSGTDPEYQELTLTQQEQDLVDSILKKGQSIDWGDFFQNVSDIVDDR